MAFGPAVRAPYLWCFDDLSERRFIISLNSEFVSTFATFSNDPSWFSITAVLLNRQHEEATLEESAYP